MTEDSMLSARIEAAADAMAAEQYVAANDFDRRMAKVALEAADKAAADHAEVLAGLECPGLSPQEICEAVREADRQAGRARVRDANPPPGPFTEKVPLAPPDAYTRLTT